MAVSRDKKGRIVMKGSVPLGGGAYHYYTKIIENVKTLAEGRAYEQKYKEQFNIENYEVKKVSYTLEELINSYNESQKLQIKSSTKQSNTYSAKNFESLYKKNICSITSKDIKKILDDKFDSGASSGYTNKIYEFINKVFNYAVRQGFIESNPVKKIPRYKRPDEIKKEMDFYTTEEFKTFIQNFPKSKNNGDYVCYVLVNVLYFMGSRFGETVALSPKDIDLKNRTIKITKTVFWYVEGKSFVLTPPKTPQSERTISIPDPLYIILEEYLEWYYSFYEVSGDMFLFGFDRPILPKTVRKRIKKACEKAQIKEIRIHDFRHSHASLLANENIPISAVAKRLGNSEKECYRTYVHLFKSSEDTIIKVINNKFK